MGDSPPWRTRDGDDRPEWAELAALKAINAEYEAPIKIRQRKYLNNIVKNSPRAI
jgi:hypothetical protein